MSKVTIGHDSCSAWTNGQEVSPNWNLFDCWNAENATTVGLGIDIQRSLTAPFLPVYLLYKGAKAVSKSVRTAS